jgi:hypothetical protein
MSFLLLCNKKQKNNTHYLTNNSVNQKSRMSWLGSPVTRLKPPCQWLLPHLELEVLFKTPFIYRIWLFAVSVQKLLFSCWLQAGLLSSPRDCSQDLYLCKQQQHVEFFLSCESLTSTASSRKHYFYRPCVIRQAYPDNLCGEAIWFEALIKFVKPVHISNWIGVWLNSQNWQS